MNQEITLNLIILNQQGKPQLILEPRQPAHLLGGQLPAGMAPSEQNDSASPLGEIIHRQPQHVGGTTLGQIMEKEHMA
jgi:hypothetical protein